MQKKKILFVIHQLNYGGVQKSLIPALDAIDYSKNEVTLYVRKNRVQLLPDVNTNVSKIIVNEDKTRYYRKPYMVYLQVLEAVSRLLKKDKWEKDIQQKMVTYINESQMKYEKEHYFNNGEEYDVAISYIQGYTTQFVAEYIKARKKVMFYHVSTDENHKIHEKSMQYFDKIVGVNKSVKRNIDSFYPEFSNKTIFLNNYVDIQTIRVKSKEFTIDKKPSEICICSCGRFAKVKGFDLAIDAAKHLKEMKMDFKWYFVGDGPDRKILEEQINKYGLNNYIEITGMQNNPYPYIAGCDIYVQPSYEEAQPLTIIEAIGLCRPVVTTATVGGKMLVKNRVNGTIVEVSGNAIANGIVEILNEMLYQKIENYLGDIDYSNDLDVYKREWRNLLEG